MGIKSGVKTEEMHSFCRGLYNIWCAVTVKWLTTRSKRTCNENTAFCVVVWLSVTPERQKCQLGHSERFVPAKGETTELQTHTRFKRTVIYYDTDTQSENVRGNPLCQATKRHLKNSWTVENDWKMRKSEISCRPVLGRSLSLVY